MRWKWWVRYRIFLYLLLGLAAVDGILHAARGTIAVYDPDDYLERLEGCRRNRPDLALVGGSTVTEGLDPAALAGLSWQGRELTRPYNLGLPGGTTSDVWLAIQHGFQAPPRLLVYGITASDLNDNRNDPHGPASLMNVQDLVRWVRARPGSAEWACRQFFTSRLARLWKLYQYRNALRYWAADRFEQSWPDSFPDTAAEARRLRGYTAALRRSDGFAPQPYARFMKLSTYRAAGLVKPTYWAMKDYHIGGYHLHKLNLLLDWAEDRKVPVVLVDMPVSADLEEQLHPREFEEYRATLAKLARQRGVPLLRASRQSLGLGDADFSDEIHLNGAGSARMGAWLRQALAERGALP